MTRDAHLAAKPYLTEARKTMTNEEWIDSKRLAEYIKTDKYELASQLVETFRDSLQVNLIEYLKKCKEYDGKDPADDPVVQAPAEEATANNQSKGFTLEANASNPTASVESNNISSDPDRVTLLEARVISLQEKCDQWKEIATNKSQDVHFTKNDVSSLKEKVEELEKREKVKLEVLDVAKKDMESLKEKVKELTDVCTDQERQLVIAREELKDYPIQSAKASKALYWENTAKTYGAYLKFLGWRIDNNYDQELFQDCVDDKEPTIKRIKRELVEGTDKYKELDGRLKKALADKNLLATLIDKYGTKIAIDNIFKAYHKQGGE